MNPIANPRNTAATAVHSTELSQSSKMLTKTPLSFSESSSCVTDVRNDGFADGLHDGLGDGAVGLEDGDEVVGKTESVGIGLEVGT